MKNKRRFNSRIQIHPRFPEEVDWTLMYNEDASRCATAIVEFMREQVESREYGKIEGLREALRFIADNFD